MICRSSDKLGKAFTEPHCNVSLHVDSKWFESFLQATDSKVTKTTDILTQVDSTNLRQPQAAHGYETYKCLKHGHQCPFIRLCLLCFGSVLTFPYLNILKSHFWAWVTDQHFSIEREHDVHFCEVDHATCHITRLPLAAKWLVSNMPTLGLKRRSREFSIIKGLAHFYNPSESASHLEAIEDIGQLVSTKFSIRTNTRPGPAHSHLSNSHSLKLKVPLPLCDGVRFLSSEHSDFITTGAARSMPT